MSFALGKPVKVRIIHVDPAATRIVASIRKLTSEVANTSGGIENIEVGQAVSGVVSEIAGENVRLFLNPNNARALVSLKNIANSRKTTVDQLRHSLQKGEEMDNLVVVSRNVDKGFVLVANKPSQKSQPNERQPPLDIKTMSIGTKVIGQVDGHTRAGATIKFPGSGRRIIGLLHRTDVSDDYDKSSTLPSVGSFLSAVVVAVDKDRRQISISTRTSRLKDGVSEVIDPEFSDFREFKPDMKVRGFIKSIAEHGLFVTISRDVDARVQIKELHDDVSDCFYGSFIS